MPKGFDELADQLMHETLSEAATTFFGARKHLDDQIEAYRNGAKDLEKIEAAVLRRTGALSHLLLDGRYLKDFFTAIGVHSPDIVDMTEPAERDMEGIAAGFTLTRKGRYVGLVQSAYELVQKEVDAYLHGRYYDDPSGSGRKLVTTNYVKLSEWCGSLNRQIEAVNANHSPSGTLCFVKGLNPSLLNKERLAGGTFDNYCQEIDEELKYQPVECQTMNYIHPPDFPPLANVRKPLRKFVRSVYARHKDEVSAILESL